MMAKEAFDIFNLCLRMIQSSASVLLNALTLICVVRYKRLRNPAGVLVACLALTDTLHGLIVYTLPVRPLVRSICTSSQAAESFTLCAQLLTFVLIAMERRNCLLVQLNRSTKWRVRDVILPVVGGWIALATFFVGYAIGTPKIPTANTCTTADSFPKAYFYLTSTYGVLCTIIIVACYSSIAKIMHSSSQQVASNTSQTEQQRQRLRAALRITKMMALVFGVFTVLYIPMGISFASITQSVPLWRHILHKLSVNLNDVNFWINPGIYAWRNKAFREAFKQLFLSCCCCHSIGHNNSVGPVNPASQQVNVQAVSVAAAEPTPSTSRSLEPRREFTVGLHKLPGTSRTVTLPTIDI